MRLVKLAGLIGFAFLVMFGVRASALLGGSTPGVGVQSPLPGTDLGATVEGVVCPAVGVGADVVPPLTPVEQAVCALSVLDLEVVTTFERPDHPPIVRVTETLPFVATPIDVDHLPGPDIIATAQAFSLTEFGFRVERAPGKTTILPLAVDLVVPDPSGALPRERIHLGYDARHTKAPKVWDTRINLGTAVSGDPTVKITTQNQPMFTGNPLAITGGLFNGTALNRHDPLGGRLAYAPMPHTSSVKLTLGDAVKRVDLTTARPAVLDAEVELVDGPKDQRITAHLDTLPSAVGVEYAAGADDTSRTITYDATGVLADLDVAYRETVGGVPAAGVVVHATGVPTHVVARQTGAKSGSVDTNGAFDTIELGLANGDPILGSVAGPYVKTLSTDTVSSVAARLDGLKRASVDVATEVVDGDETIRTLAADVELTDAGRQPLRLDVDAPGGLHIGGVIDRLPNHLTLNADFAGPVIHYNGHGQGIDDVTVDASQATPFFDKYTDLSFHVADIKPTLELRVVDLFPNPPFPAAGRAISASPAVGLVEFGATNGKPMVFPVGDNAGLTYVDKPGQFVLDADHRIGARVRDFENVSIATLPQDQIDVSAIVRSEPFHVRFENREMTVVGVVKDLPHTLDLSFRPPNGDASGYLRLRTDDTNATIAQVGATILKRLPFFDREDIPNDADPTILQLNLDGVPANLDMEITASPAGAGFSLADGQSIGSIRALLKSDMPTPDIPFTGAGAFVRAMADRFVAYGRLDGVRQLTFGNDPLTLRLRTDTPQPFTVDAQFDRIDDQLLPAVVTGHIHDLPSDINLRQLGGFILWDAAETVDSLVLHALSLPGGSGQYFDGGVHYAHVEVDGLPRSLVITTGSELSGIESVAPPGGTPDPIGRIFVQISDFDAPLGDNPTAAGNIARVEQLGDGGRYVVDARMRNLVKAVVNTTDTDQTFTLAFGDASPPDALGAFVRLADGITLAAEVPDPPTTMTLHHGEQGNEGQEQSIDVTTSPGGIPLVDLTIEIPDTLGVRFRFRDIPEGLHFCVASSYQPGCGDPLGPHPFPDLIEPAATIPHALTAQLSTVGAEVPLRIDGRICLKPVAAEPLEDGDVVPKPYVPPAGPSWDPDCRLGDGSNTANYVEFSDILLRDIHVSVMSGDSSPGRFEDVDDDDPECPCQEWVEEAEEDDILALYLDTSGFVGRIWAQENIVGEEEQTRYGSVRMLRNEGDGDPLVAENFGVAVDTTDGLLAFSDHIGSLCVGDSEFLFGTHKDPATGGAAGIDVFALAVAQFDSYCED